MAAPLTLALSFAAIGFPILMLGVMLLCSFRLIAFNKNTPIIESEDDIANFKREAAFNMYSAFMANILFWITLIAVLAASIMVSWYYLLVFPMFFIVLIVMTQKFVPMEKQVRFTPANSEALDQERSRIAQIWEKERFPSW